MEDRYVPDFVSVAHLEPRPERYQYHGKSEVDRTGINHGTGQRHVMDNPDIAWPFGSPEVCEDYSDRGTWFKTDDGKQYLLCTGCGLDCT